MNEKLIAEVITYWPFTVALGLCLGHVGLTLLGLCWSLLVAYVDERDRRPTNPWLDFLANLYVVPGTARAVSDGESYLHDTRSYRYHSQLKLRLWWADGDYIDCLSLFMVHVFVIPGIALLICGTVFLLGDNLIWPLAAYAALWTARQATRGVKKGAEVMAKLDLHKEDKGAHQ